MGRFVRPAAVLGACLAATPVNAVGGPGDTSQARADLQQSGEEGGAQASLRNQTYDLIRAQLGPDRFAWTNLLVHRQQEVVKNVQMDGFLKKELMVEVFEVEGTKKHKLFEFKEPASDSSIREDLGVLVASSYGCCDSTDAHAVYSLKNGKRLFFAGGDKSPYILHVFWPNTDRAYLVGVHVSGSDRDDEVYRGLAEKKGRRRMLVSMASKTAVTDQVAILFDDGDMSPPVEAVEWLAGKRMKVFDRQLEVWPAKGDQPAPVPSIQIRLTGGRNVLIPLDGDHFGRISAPEGATVVRPSSAN